jgi:signal transduction histidine kinase
LYRITQEALNNVIKYAKATRCDVAVRWTPTHLRLTINDDGRGFDPNAISQVHFGLGIMKERAEAVGASLAIRSRAGGGTMVEVTRQAAIDGVT